MNIQTRPEIEKQRDILDRRALTLALTEAVAGSRDPHADTAAVGAILREHLAQGRAEIKRRFDEIVAFAEVERFLDTPVKHYSSGMYLRLAFAVAAHLEPEILLVDEVLAVGDARFQKKCLNKMQDVGRQGRTVLFVSHNMSAITRLC
jgi:ABC-type polysaccharide/polyol phosphate transport system ATPase subunit